MGAYTELNLVVENGNIVIPADSMGDVEEGAHLRLRVEVVPTDPEQTEQEAKIADETAYFVAHHAEMRRQYEGQFVAIHQHQVVDHDKDEGVLYLRVGETWGVETPILITEVSDTPIKEFFVYSNRLDH